MEVGNNYLDLGLDFLEDIDFWLEELEMKIKIPTGMIHLDTKLDGGLSKGEVGIFLGPPNRKKSQALVNTGFGAMSMFSNSSVVHITVEMSAIVVAKRYAARLVSSWFVKGRTNRDEYAYMVKDKASKLLKGKLIIKEFPSRSATVYDIKAYLKQLKIAGHKFDVVIIDYLDELKHSGVGELRHQLRETVSNLRSLAHPTNMNVAIWTATQANRSSLNNEIITMEHISESFGKAEVADVVIALCQTKLEMQYELMRLYGAKVRDGASGFLVYCSINEDAHAILSVSNEDYKAIMQKEKERNVEVDVMKHIADIIDQ
jgi:replicative DNA helicase